MFLVGSRGDRLNAVVHHGFPFLLLLFVLVPGLAASQEATLTNRMRVISEDLDRQLNGIMASQALNYTVVNTTGLPYNATTKFNPKGMGQLYNVTNSFIDFVQTKQAYPEGERLTSDLCFSGISRARRVGSVETRPETLLRVRDSSTAALVTPCAPRSKMAGPRVLVNRSLSKKYFIPRSEAHCISFQRRWIHYGRLLLGNLVEVYYGEYH